MIKSKGKNIRNDQIFGTNATMKTPVHSNLRQLFKWPCNQSHLSSFNSFIIALIGIFLIWVKRICISNDQIILPINTEKVSSFVLLFETLNYFSLILRVLTWKHSIKWNWIFYLTKTFQRWEFITIKKYLSTFNIATIIAELT